MKCAQLLNPDELSALAKAESDHELLDCLIREKYLLVVDWKGEEEASQIGKFLQSRATALIPGTLINIGDAYAAMEKEELSVGDAVPFLLKHFQQILKKLKLTIILLDQQNDSYYIGLVKDDGLKDLKKQNDEFWKFSAFGSSTGEVLYTVNCDCGSMNVWQLKRGEPLTDDVCQDCGKELFDKEGNASLPVIREYI
ncbi:DUF6630 family protein [Chitinophaga barathri]|uniref:DUF6630 domain-containing protein n=1 Tax=Chitinophaga barathri TaxID=1647451 RepID=A0A3N4ME89_9BACT|nr:hypothetical protein [Chitinophaga barathri]RPD38039.1 hypothetical protein EG028_26870 [Chitinophaga barathri]